MNKSRLIVFSILAGVAILGAQVYQKVRGLRNNNPGNIRFNEANDWVGQVGQDKDGYAIFSDPKYGIRAAGKVLDAYARQGVLSIRQIITRWAPAGDNNDTEAYIKHVVQLIGRPDYFVPVRSEGDYLDLVKAIIKHENGVNPYSDDDIKAGLSLA